VPSDLDDQPGILASIVENSMESDFARRKRRLLSPTSVGNMDVISQPPDASPSGGPLSLSSETEPNSLKSAPSGLGKYSMVFQTAHKGGCRCAAFSLDGTELFFLLHFCRASCHDSSHRGRKTSGDRICR